MSAVQVFTPEAEDATPFILPRRVLGRTGHARHQPDGPEAVFELLAEGHDEGIPGALVTVTSVTGGSARGIGAQMAVLSDGRHAGFLSGGCIEPAIAVEALRVISTGLDEELRIGAGSPFMDLRLPCGGSMLLHLHARPDAQLIYRALDLIARREPFDMLFDARSGTVSLTNAADKAVPRAPGDAYWRRFEPRIRLLLVGRGPELETIAQIAPLSGFDVVATSTDPESLARLSTSGITVTPLVSPSANLQPHIDAFTAVVFLFHDHDYEIPLIANALKAEPIYLGALGSRRTHERRKERLRAFGLDEAMISRIRGPVGLFGPTRDAAGLALSVLADVAQVRLGG